MVSCVPAFWRFCVKVGTRTLYVTKQLLFSTSVLLSSQRNPQLVSKHSAYCVHQKASIFEVQIQLNPNHKDTDANPRTKIR